MTSGGPDIKVLFTGALEHPPGPDRDAYLAGACGGDAALRRRVEELLAALDRASDVLGPAGPPATATEAEAPADADAPTRASEPAHQADPEATEARTHATNAGLTVDRGPDPAPAGLATVAAPDDQGLDRNGDGLAPGSAVRYFGDYEIRRELGRGGMGIVYEARQVSLNRPVALKVVRAGLLAGDDELRRFQNEAEAVALLDHPGVVPVYEVGEHDGQRYFSMKLVTGGSLVPLMDRYKADTRAAARLVAEAAEAVAHAHARGILHRDLKPANILVDAEGHPHVTDFGLAKRVEADVELTQSGAILGTPAYMSPEQASGRRGSVTTASDVYGLGAVLYALLTGRAPFGGDSIVETIDAVRNARPEPPRRLNAAIPRDLETICLKCLEKDPRRRYPTAQALADDLNAWLDSRPIAARRVGVAERAWLWCRRKPAVAALTAAVLLAVVAGTATVIAVQSKANAELRAANRRVQQRYELAVDAIKTFYTGVSEDFLLKQDQFKGLRDRLLKSANDFYGKLRALLGQETDSASRRALLQANFEVAELTRTVGRIEDALAAHRAVLTARKALAKEPQADPEMTVEVARSLVAVASIQRQTGKADEALATYRKAMTLLDDPARPPTAAARALLADCHTGLGLLLSGRGDPAIAEAQAEHRQALAITQELVNENAGVADYLGRLAETHLYLASTATRLLKRSEAGAEYRQAMTLYRRLADDHPAVTDYRMSLVDCHLGLGSVLRSTGTVAEADVELREALRICRKLVDDYPGITGVRQRLADCHNDRYVLMMRIGRPAEAQAELREAVAIYQRLVDDHPTVTELRDNLATSRYNLAGSLLQAGKPAEAEAEFRRAMLLYQKLADDAPAVTHYRERAVGIYSEIGSVKERMGKPAEAEVEYRRAMALYRRLADDHPGVTGFRIGLAGSHHALARLAEETGKLTEAEVEYRRAIAVYEKLADDHPGVTNFRERLAYLHSLLGVFLSAFGKPTDAEAEYRRAIALHQKLADDHPGEQVFGLALAGDHYMFGQFLWNTAGRPAEAEAEYRRFLAISQKLADDHPGSSDLRGRLAGSHEALGGLLSQTGKPAEAEAECRRALAIQQKLAEDDPGDPRLRVYLAQCRRQLGVVLSGANKPAEAEVEFRQALAIQQKLVDDYPETPWFRTGLAETLASVGRSQQAVGHWSEAARAFRQAIAITERPPRATSMVGDRYDLACYQSLLSGVLDRPGSGPSAAGGREAADRAMRQLREAVAAGYRNRAHMQTDTDLDPLRTRPDFQLLMMDLAMPADPFARRD